MIQTEEEIEGMPGSYLYSLFEGSGGLYRFYLTNAFLLGKGLSVGLNVGMVRGKITQSETQEGAVVEYESSKRAFYADLGLHYEYAPSGGGPDGQLVSFLHLRSPLHMTIRSLIQTLQQAREWIKTIPAEGSICLCIAGLDFL